MSYQVLARKWRPQTFAELVGQDRVLSGLINALNAKKLHHAYLFTGARGVGKTTIARIMAKSLNCEQGISATPCGKCDACVEITQGRFIDLIEIDAASRTKVDDTRELLDNVPFAATRGHFKIYLIDEVHMLSNHSFNALLKTLEEPPEHVKFLLATTDPQKLPITVLSRCLQFHLRNIDQKDIIKQLEFILSEEKIPYDPPALNLIAIAAKGSLRDALSLLDQAISYGNEHVNEDATRVMLGKTANEHIYNLLESIVTNNAKTLLDTVNMLAEGPHNYNEILSSLTQLLHQIALTQQLPGAQTTPFSTEKVAHFSQKTTAQSIQLLYQIALIGQRDLPLSPDPKLGLEMVLLRMLAFIPERLIATTPKPQSVNTQSPPKKDPLPTKKPTSPLHSSPPKPTAAAAKPKTDTTDNQPLLNWQETVKKVPLSGVAKQFLTHCSLSNFKDDTLSLVVAAPYSNILNKKLETKLRQALVDHLKKPIKLMIHVSTSNNETPAMIEQRLETKKQHELDQSIEDDQHVEFIKTKFNAKIANNKTKAVD